MPRIEWKGIIDNPADYQRGYLSENAKKLNMPKTLNEMMIKALPFVIPSILIIDPVAVILGFICGVLALPVHELLHAIVYPSKSAVVIGFVPKQFAAVALASFHSGEADLF